MMKRYKMLWATVLIALLMGACGQSNKKTEEEPEEISNANEFEKRIAAIDNNPDLQVINSLSYNDNAGNTVEARAFLDKDQKEVRIEEDFSDAKTGNYGTNTFYVHNGKKFATREIYFDKQRKEKPMVERVSYYDDKAKVLYTKIRYAEGEEQLNNEGFKGVASYDCPEERVMRVINQEGEYRTTFQGFVQSNGMVYALVGGPGKDDPVSSLSVQHKYGDISKLLADERGNIGRLVRVQHETMMSPQGLRFQVLIALEFVE
jgi:hypothetical protein